MEEAIAFVIPALAGMGFGQRLRSKIDPQRFHRWLLVLGVQMLVNALL